MRITYWWLLATSHCFTSFVYIICFEALQCEIPHDDTFNYMAGIDRGGLTWATDLLHSIVVQCMITFKCLVSSTHANNFNLTQNQRAIASGLALQRCLDVLDISGKCSGCGAAPADIMKLCIATVTNISLNNYSKSQGMCKANQSHYENCQHWRSNWCTVMLISDFRGVIRTMLRILCSV